nr:DUF1513 domain-containing protein [uncultured Rhodoferax sp.]
MLRDTALGAGAAWLALQSHDALAHGATAASLRVLTSWTRGESAFAGIWTPGGRPARGIALPARAHALLGIPPAVTGAGPQALVLARRPGEYLLRMDVANTRALQWHTMEDDRYLAGHACPSLGGNSFFSTETDGETGAGLVAERDWRSLRKLREFASHGIGPHALCTHTDGTLWVANGGILNLPESGRRKLNLGRMAPNLSAFDAVTGEVRTQYTLEDPFLSLRHLAVAPDGTIGVAMQAEHTDAQARARAPALAILRDGQLRAVPWANDQPPAGWDGYAGDVSYMHGRFWISAPHAGWLASWTLFGEDQWVVHLAGAGALATSGTQLVAAGSADALLLSPASPTQSRYPLHLNLDNHAALLDSTLSPSDWQA